MGEIGGEGEGYVEKRRKHRYKMRKKDVIGREVHERYVLE